MINTCITTNEDRYEIMVETLDGWETIFETTSYDKALEIEKEMREDENV